jgi:putative lipoprotein
MAKILSIICVIIFMPVCFINAGHSILFFTKYQDNGVITNMLKRVLLFFSPLILFAFFACQTTDTASIKESEPAISEKPEVSKPAEDAKKAEQPQPKPPVSKVVPKVPPNKPVQPKPIQPKPSVASELDFSNKLKELLAKNKFNEALKLFDTYDQNITQKPSIQNLKLAILISNNNLDEASVLADSLEKKYPNNTETLLAQSYLAAMSKNQAKRSAYLKKIIALEPKHSEALTELGNDAYSAKSYATAAKYYSQAIAANDGNDDAMVGLADVLYMQGDFAKSEEQLAVVLKRNPKNASAYAMLARVQFEQNQVLPAIENINKAIKLEQDIPEFWSDKGLYCSRAGKLKEALAAYSKVISLEPENYIAYIYRAGINDNLKNKAEAISDYQKVLELYPSYYFAAEGLGVLYFEKGEYLKAGDAFYSAWKNAVDKNFYALMVTICYYQLGDAKKAKDFMSKQLPSIDRKNNETLYFLSRLFVDHVGDSDVTFRLSKEENKTKRYRMQFYLAKFYELVKKSTVAVKLYEQVSECQYPAFFEYRLVEAELAKNGIAPKAK